MSYLTSMRDRRKTPHAAWHKIRTTMETGRFDIFAVFEGEEDEEFYSKYLYRRDGNLSINPIVCDGKGGLLALYDRVKEKYGSLRNVYFFVDADHDSLLGLSLPSENAFITDGYSFESYGLSAHAVLGIVERNFSLHPTDPILNDVQDIVRCAMRVFCRRARMLMTYVVCLRRVDVQVDVDSLHFYKFFKFEADQLKVKNISCAAVLSDAGVTKPVPISQLLSTVRELRQEEDASIIRGKMVAQFLINFLKCLTKTLPGKVKINGKSCSVRVELGGGNYPSQISDVVPESLRLSQFLDQIIVDVRGVVTTSNF